MIVYDVRNYYGKAWRSVLNVADGSVSYDDGVPGFGPDKRYDSWDKAFKESQYESIRSVWIVPGTYSED